MRCYVAKIPKQRLLGFEANLRAAKRVALVCHRKPDGDAIGSTLGLAGSLALRGTNVALVCVDPVPSHYHFLPGTESFRRTLPKSADAVVVLDCARDSMTGFTTDQLRAVGPIISVDHHPRGPKDESVRIGVYDQRASSAAEIVYHCLHELGWPIDRDVATALLTGIITDTSAFQNSATTAATLRTAAQLMRRGGRLKEIMRECYYSSSVPKLRLWGMAMSRIEHDQHTGVASTVITADDLKEAGAHPDDLEGLVNFLNSVPGVPAVLLLTDLHDGQIKGSLRTREEDVDVSHLAGLLGGGGHTKAAGFTVKGRLSRVADGRWQVASSEPTENTAVPIQELVS